MPTGTVRDEGDPGMKGQRIGQLQHNDNYYLFNNGDFGDRSYYKEGEDVVFIPIRKSGYAYALVLGRFYGKDFSVESS